MRYPGRIGWRFMVLLLPAFLLGGCAGTGGGNMEDNTGDLGKNEQQRTGAGDVYVKLAVAYMRAGKLDVALQQAKKAITLDPGNGDALDVLALIYDRLGEVQLAEHYFKRGMAAEPNNSFIHNAYGAFLCRQARNQEAMREFDKALRNPLYPTPEVALTNAGICSGNMGDRSQSETYLRAALRKNPQFSLALLEMAKLSLAKTDYLTARAYLQRYAAVAPHSAESLWVGIQVEHRLGDRDAVASYALKLRSNFPESREAQLFEGSEYQ